MLGIKICGMADFLSVVNTLLVVNANRNEVFCEKLFLGHLFTFPHCSDAEIKSYIIKFLLIENSYQLLCHKIWVNINPLPCVRLTPFD